MKRKKRSSSKYAPRNEASHPKPKARERLFDEAIREAARHKWIESEKAGRDLGENAIREWHRNYWRFWCRERWVEHLRGDRFWIELDQNDYGILCRDFQDNMELAEKILEKIRTGGENLDIIQWAAEENYDHNAVIQVLETLDINARRLAPPDEYYIDDSQREEEPRRDRVSKVLVVDDDKGTCDLLQQVFENEGFKCTTLGTAEEAIELIHRQRFDCYLIDIMLPGKHGAEVAWYLRRRGVDVPVIAISALLDRWSEADLYDCGFTAILPKPFDLRSLRALAAEIIERKKK
ncbi:MAG: response regulator [Planctomycetes bacterium]|nr:response regulator [Planctomycetota bacterium]